MAFARTEKNAALLLGKINEIHEMKTTSKMIQAQKVDAHETRAVFTFCCHQPLHCSLPA
jgi:hypothetical protein